MKQTEIEKKIENLIKNYENLQKKQDKEKKNLTEQIFKNIEVNENDCKSICKTIYLKARKEKARKEKARKYNDIFSYSMLKLNSLNNEGLEKNIQNLWKNEKNTKNKKAFLNNCTILEKSLLNERVFTVATTLYTIKTQLEKESFDLFINKDENKKNLKNLISALKYLPTLTGHDKTIRSNCKDCEICDKNEINNICKIKENLKRLLDKLKNTNKDRALDPTNDYYKVLHSIEIVKNVEEEDKKKLNKGINNRQEERLEERLEENNKQEEVETINNTLKEDKEKKETKIETQTETLIKEKIEKGLLCNFSKWFKKIKTLKKYYEEIKYIGLATLFSFMENTSYTIYSQRNQKANLIETTSKLFVAPLITAYCAKKIYPHIKEKGRFKHISLATLPLVSTVATQSTYRFFNSFMKKRAAKIGNSIA